MVLDCRGRTLIATHRLTTANISIRARVETSCEARRRQGYGGQPSQPSAGPASRSPSRLWRRLRRVNFYCPDVRDNPASRGEGWCSRREWFRYRGIPSGSFLRNAPSPSRFAGLRPTPRGSLPSNSSHPVANPKSEIKNPKSNWLVLPAGIEPTSPASETGALSIVLQERRSGGKLRGMPSACRAILAKNCVAYFS